MEGGFFSGGPTGEKLLPAGIVCLEDAGAVCRRRWDLLALTAAGCRRLADRHLTARVLLLPGDCAPGRFQADRVVTYGLSPRDSITLSSLAQPVLCVQRTLPLVWGGELEPQEFPMPTGETAERLLPWAAARLLWTGSPYA